MNQTYDPYTGKPVTPLPPPKKRKPKWVIAVIVIGVIAVIGGIGSMLEEKEADPTEVGAEINNQTQAAETETKTEAPTEALTEVPDYYGVGETLNIDGLKITLLEVRESEGEQFNHPDDGNIFLQLIFEISNESRKDASFSSIMNFDIYVDGYSQSTSLSATIDVDEGSLDGSVAVGK